MALATVLQARRQSREATDALDDFRNPSSALAARLGQLVHIGRIYSRFIDFGYRRGAGSDYIGAQDGLASSVAAWWQLQDTDPFHHLWQKSGAVRNVLAFAACYEFLVLGLCGSREELYEFLVLGAWRFAGDRYEFLIAPGLAGSRETGISFQCGSVELI